MLIGHFGVALATKKIAPQISLGTLFFATLLADLICIPLLLLGIENVLFDPGNTAVTPLHFAHYPYSHSLLFSVFWATVFAILYRQRSEARPLGVRRAPSPQIMRPFGQLRRSLANRLILWLVVVSHWVLDFISHGPDLCLYPGSHKVGLGLWNSHLGTLVIEGGFFLAAVWLYTSSTHAKNQKGRWALFGLVVYLVVTYLLVVFSLPEPTTTLFVMALVGQVFIVVLAYWVDSLREIKQP